MLINRRLYPSWYRNRLYLNQYERDENGNNKILITAWLKVWLEIKDESKLILGSREH